MDEPTLLRCPFCGSPVTVTTMQIEHPDWWAAAANCDGIYDNGCSCQMVAGGDTEQQAVEKLLLLWNRRVR